MFFTLKILRRSKVINVEKSQAVKKIRVTGV